MNAPRRSPARPSGTRAATRGRARRALLVVVVAASAALAACSTPVAPPDSGRADAPDAPMAPDAARDAADITAPDAPDDVALDAPSDAPHSTDAMRADAPTADAAVAPMFPIVDPPPGYSGLPSSAPLTLRDVTGRTISRVSIQNPSGPCIEIRGGADIVIEDVALGPCSGSGVNITGGARGVTIRRSYVHDTGGEGVSTEGVTDVRVLDSHFARNRSAVYAVRSQGVRVERNTALNVLGPFPRGQLAQFNAVTGAGNAVLCNAMQNDPGASNPEDGINLYMSQGTESSPIVIEGNRILGGGPSTSGGGILLGDNGGAYQVARGNIVVDPGQYGIAAASGEHLSLVGNRVFARSQPFTNVGLYVWNQYMTPCGDVSVRDNAVRWANRDGNPNPFWNGGNCGALDLGGNDWSAALTAAVINEVPAACR